MSTQPQYDEKHVASLAQAIYDTGEVNLPLSDALDVDCFDVARAMIKAGLA